MCKFEELEKMGLASLGKKSMDRAIVAVSAGCTNYFVIGEGEAVAAKLLQDDNSLKDKIMACTGEEYVVTADKLLINITHNSESSILNEIQRGKDAIGYMGQVAGLWFLDACKNPSFKDIKCEDEPKEPEKPVQFHLYKIKEGRGSGVPFLSDGDLVVVVKECEDNTYFSVPFIQYEKGWTIDDYEEKGHQIWEYFEAGDLEAMCPELNEL